MDKITNVKAQLRLQEWARLIEECHASNMTVSAWCEENNINIKTYYYRLCKVREHTLEHVPALKENLPTPTEDKSVSFKQLQVASPIYERQSAVTVHFANVTVEISAGTDQKTVEAVLLALKTVC